MQNDCETFSDDRDKFDVLEEFTKLSYETALDNIRFHTTDIWQEDPTKCDVLKPVLSNICLKNELLQERFSTVTAADILAGISFDSQEEKLKNIEKKSIESDEDDFFSSFVFSLKQECSDTEDYVIEQDTNQNESSFCGDARAVGFGREERQYVTYSEPFDPMVTFAGLQDVVFPNYRFLRPDDNPQDNVCLAVDDVSDIVHEYLNKYQDYLADLRSPPGDWVHQPDAILPPKFASFDLWTTDKNEISVDKETDQECRLLAAKVTSSSVRRLWSDGSSYTPSTSDDQDVFSHHGSVSEESTSPWESTNMCHGELDYNEGFHDASSYPFFQTSTEEERQGESVSQLWSGRNVDSFKDFIPRLSYGFNLPVPDVVHEPKSASLGNVVGNRPERSNDDKEEKTASKFFNIWCVPDLDDGQGDGVSSRCSENSASPPGSQSLSEKSSPDAGLQIPRLVSTKRRERPIRGFKNTRRSNVKDYQVTFVESADKSDDARCPEASTVSSSRAAYSDTTVWTTNGFDRGMPSAENAKRGFSRSETHQEYRTDRPEDQRYDPVTDKIELSVQSEPFFPRGTASGLSGCDSLTGERLKTIDEELMVKDSKNSILETLEKRLSLSPTCEPFVPKTMQRDSQPDQPEPNLHHQQLEDDQHGNFELDRDSIYNSPETPKSTGRYVAWSPATDGSEVSPVREYKLFGPGKSFLEHKSVDLDDDKWTTYNKQLGHTDSLKLSECDWQRPSGDEKERASRSWDNSSKMSLNEVELWEDAVSKQLIPYFATQKTVGLPEEKPTSMSTRWHNLAQNQNVWSKPGLCQQSQSSIPISFRNIPPVPSLPHHSGISSIGEKPGIGGRIIRPQSQSPQLELKPSLDITGRDYLTEPRPRQYHPWAGTETPILTTTSYPHQEGNRVLQSQGVPPVRTNPGVSFMSNQVTCLPTPQHYDAAYRKMVVLHPPPKRPDLRPAMHTAIFPHTLAPQPTLRPTSYPTLRQPLTPGIQRLSLDQHSRLQSSVISRPNTAFAPPAGFSPAVPPQTYRHVTVAANYNAPKLVAVPAFDTHPQPGFFTSYLNFNNHNDAYISDSDVSEVPVDPIGFRDDVQELRDRHARPRPIRANPANLIHIT